MPIQAVKAVLFDFGNVLGFFNHLKACEAICDNVPEVSIALDPEGLRDYIFDDGGLGRAFELGQFTTNEFLNVLRKQYELDPELSDKKLEVYWGDIFTEVTGVGKVLEQIKKFVPLGILSNTDPIHWQYIKRLPVMQKHFNDEKFVTTSFEMKSRKPSKEMYLAAAAKFELEPREIVFIDDLKKNVTAAENLGFQAEHFNALSDSPKKLAEILSRYGLIGDVLKAMS